MLILAFDVPANAAATRSTTIETPFVNVFFRGHFVFEKVLLYGIIVKTILSVLCFVSSKTSIFVGKGLNVAKHTT